MWLPSWPLACPFASSRVRCICIIAINTEETCAACVHRFHSPVNLHLLLIAKIVAQSRWHWREVYFVYRLDTEKPRHRAHINRSYLRLTSQQCSPSRGGRHATPISSIRHVSAISPLVIRSPSSMFAGIFGSFNVASNFFFFVARRAARHQRFIDASMNVYIPPLNITAASPRLFPTRDKRRIRGERRKTRASYAVDLRRGSPTSIFASTSLINAPVIGATTNLRPRSYDRRLFLRPSCKGWINLYSNNSSVI